MDIISTIRAIQKRKNITIYIENENGQDFILAYKGQKGAEESIITSGSTGYSTAIPTSGDVKT